MNSDIPLKDAIVYHDKENYDIEKYIVHQKFDKASIFPDLAVLSLRTDIESKKLIAIRAGQSMSFIPRIKRVSF